MNSTKVKDTDVKAKVKDLLVNDQAKVNDL